MSQVASTIRRITSGIDELDKLIMGGIPEGTTTMVYGSPKAGKSVFAYHFLNECIRLNEACLFVMADYVSQDLFLATSGFGWNIQKAFKENSLQLVDMSSTHSDIAMSEQTPSTSSLRLVSLADPTDLMKQSGEVLRQFSQSGVKFRTVLDSLTPLFIYNPPMIVAKVLRQFAQRMKGGGSQGVIVTYTEGSVDSQSEVIIRSSVDNLVHLVGGELIVEGMLGTPKARASYEISNSGIRLGGST